MAVILVRRIFGGIFRRQKLGSYTLASTTGRVCGQMYGDFVSAVCLQNKYILEQLFAPYHLIMTIF